MAATSPTAPGNKRRVQITNVQDSGAAVPNDTKVAAAGFAWFSNREGLPLGQTDELVMKYSLRYRIRQGPSLT